MAQHDFVINNQGFPAVRSDINDFLNAVRTTHSGTSRPTGAVAGTIFLDTTSPTVPILKYFDGTDDITLATINHTANTVDFADSSVVVTGLSSTATGTVLTLTDSANTTTVNLIIDNQKEIRFRETTANGTNFVALKAPASLSADATFTLPSTDGTNGQFLSTNGSGVLSFATVGGSTTPFAVIGNATSGSEIRLPEDTDNGSNYVALKAPDTLSADLTLTLPSADGSAGQVLQTNGSGVLSFAGVSASAGQVIQVVSTHKQDTYSQAGSTTFTDITGLSVSITPSASANKILVFVNLCASSSAVGGRMAFRLVRASTAIGGGTASGNRQSSMMSLAITNDTNTQENGGFNFLDSPSTTSSTTYKVQMISGDAGTAKINSSSGDNDSNEAFGTRTASTITVMEIKG